MKADARAEAILLRTEQRLSLKEIEKRLDVSRGSLSGWLKDYPLTENELAERRKKVPRGLNKKDRGEESKFNRAIDGRKLTKQQKGALSETAVLFRLILNGFHVSRPVFDSAKNDWFVEIPETGRTVKIQVKFAQWLKTGLPVIPLTCREGNSTRRYNEGEWDFIIGYDIYTDTAYVFSFRETEGYTRAITITPESAENWSKLTSGD